MADGWGSNGILHGRNSTDGLDERPDVEDYGPFQGSRGAFRVLRRKWAILSPSNTLTGAMGREKSHSAYTLCARLGGYILSIWFISHTSM